MKKYFILQTMEINVNLYLKMRSYFILQKMEMNKFNLVINEKKENKSNSIDNLYIDKLKKKKKPTIDIDFFLCHFLLYI
jgi:hypothetical protein